MNILLTLLFKLLPLYLIIFLGYLLGRFYKIDRISIAKILIYIIAPIIIFNGIAKAQLTLATISLPLLFLIVGTILCLSFYYFAKKIWRGAEKNIIAFTAGTANTGYFGLPVAIILFGDSIVPYAVLIILGTVLYENVIGLYIIGKGRYSSHESIKHLLKLPNIYACFLGFSANLLHLHFGSNYNMFITNFQSCYVVLGMLLIGLGISELHKVKFDWQFTVIAFAAKFLAWPILIWTAIQTINYFIPNFYTQQLSDILLVMTLVPLAANTVVYATALNLHPEKTALTVLLSTMFTLFYMPLMLLLFTIK